MEQRLQIPARRPSVNLRVKRPVSFANPTAGESTFFLTVGFDPETLKPCEVFYAEGFRSGSDLEFLVIDACIIISVAIQSGVPLADLQKSLSTIETPNGESVDASILALIVRTLMSEEKDILEDLLAAAVNDAVRRVEENQKEKISLTLDSSKKYDTIHKVTSSHLVTWEISMRFLLRESDLHTMAKENKFEDTLFFN